MVAPALPVAPGTVRPAGAPGSAGLAARTPRCPGSAARACRAV